MLFATNIADFLACQHISTLERQEKLGEVEKTYYADPGAELLRKLGLEHEAKYLKELREVRGLEVVEISTEGGWEKAAKATRQAMRQGLDAIYQATFIQGQWGGRADFLLRVETPSELGPWSYEVVETKLAKSTKARALMQLCFYSELVAAIQGKDPEKMHVVLGRGTKPEEFRVQRYFAFFRKEKTDYQAALGQLPITYPEPVEHCFVCDWSPNCDERWHADDHLSLVAGITRKQRKALVEVGVRKVEELARFPLKVKAVGSEPRTRSAVLTKIAPAPMLRIREQARVQVLGRVEAKPVHELIEPIDVGMGLAALPLPSSGDLFLDFEGDPFAFDQGLEYLIGTVEERRGDGARGRRGELETRSVERKQGDVALSYEARWAFNPAEEKKAFERFIADVMERRRQYPDMHIYHYSAYEPTAIKHLAGRHGVCTDQVDELLRGEVFVDLYRVVRQGLRASVESYSIKKMEPFYGFQRSVALRDATSSLQAFESVLALGDEPKAAQEILKTIADYNSDDCVSTWRLREWLEQLRSEAEAKLGSSLPRPEPKSGAPSEELETQLTEITLLKQRLTSGLAEDESVWTNEQRACWLMAQLLEWHRREDKSMWWEYYRLCDLSDDELIEDKNALGGLVYQGVVDETKGSFIHRYSFPIQDHTIDRALDVHDPRTQKSAGTFDRVDDINLTVDLKRGKRSDKPHPTALIPSDFIDNKKQVASLVRIATWVAEHGIRQEITGSGSKPPFPTCTKEEAAAKGMFQAARDILLRHTPRVTGKGIEELTEEFPLLLDTAKALALSLDSSALPIQGPPGSGKTYTGAHMIIELVNAGKRVGVTANSHKVISNLLTTLCKEANELDINLAIVQKPDKDKVDVCKHDFVSCVTDNSEVLEKLSTGEAHVAAGTAWLWSREEFAGSVDVLFVDEAGQMSLANVLALSQAARSVVLLGDPQQLDQPQQGVHPPGAEVSALAHLLNGRATIEPHQGLFLSESWRLHPDICEFTSEAFYDGRLTTRTENALQRLNAQGLLDGTGLRFVPVIHDGNQSASPEEVERIAELVEELLNNAATWTNKKGKTALLTLRDILIVAPYNAQVELLAQRLPKDARIGTVDKFQGQEAPVVFYSMTTSTPEDAPRGMEFLYSSNRLNVATSRAQCVTVLVASPELFDVSCKTPRQMELANAFCRYLEMAQ